jgi:hypothetical protein
MDDDEETTDDLVDMLAALNKEVKLMRERFKTVERYLRDEGYGESDEETDDDDD